jgi:inorganic pyrophosphatase
VPEALFEFHQGFGSAKKWGGGNMGIQSIPFAGTYLEHLPLNKIAKSPGGPPKNSVPFIGYPQQHPTEKNKLILVYDPLGETPTILEFKIEDILYVEDVPQAVTEQGEGVPMTKLWIRRGSHGMILEPFEVDESLRFLELRRGQKERFSKKAGDNGYSPAQSARL